MRLRLLFYAFCLVSAACSGPLAPTTEFSYGEDHGGVVVLSLTAEDDEGRHYRLRETKVELTGAALATLREPRGLAPDSLNMPLPAGDYSSYLNPGYRVVEILDDGSERTVSATLVEPNPSLLRVPPQQDVAIPLSFEIDDHRVVFSRKPVRVSQASAAQARRVR